MLPRVFLIITLQVYKKFYDIILFVESFIIQGVGNVFGAIENIYGDEFLPSVKASCAGLSMTVRVDTKNPFEGVIHAVNHK